MGAVGNSQPCRLCHIGHHLSQTDNILFILRIVGLCHWNQWNTPPPPYLRHNVKATTLLQHRKTSNEMKWNESGFRPPLCTYRLNWARRTSWGWWDDWDDTVLQTQDSKFEPWRSEAEHATSRSRRFPTILTFTRGWGRNIFVSCNSPRPGTEPRTLAWKAAVLTTTLGPPPSKNVKGFTDYRNDADDVWLFARQCF